MKYYVYCFLFLVIGYSVASKKDYKQHIVAEQNQVYIGSNAQHEVQCANKQNNRKQPLDTIIKKHIYNQCAITVSPDTNWINEQQSSMSEDSWMELVNDIIYYQSIAVETLQANDIDVINKVDHVQHFYFHKSDSSLYEIPRDSLRDKWGLLLFNGTNDPQYWEGVDIESQIKNYFKK